MRVPPKVQVRIISEPASTNELASFKMMSGLSMMRSSGGRPGLRPIFCKFEPVAPSATRISPLFNRSRNLFIYHLVGADGHPPLLHEIFRHRVCDPVRDQMGDMFEWLAHVRKARRKHELVLELGV